MATSVPTAPDDTANLADVLPSCLVALGAADPAWLASHGLEARITLRPARSAIVVLVDGLGAQALAERKGHARFLAASRRRMRSGFPTTTAAALSTLTTGQAPATHGVVGFEQWNAQDGVVMNMLGGWDEQVPEGWLQSPTVFSLAPSIGVDPVVVGPGRYRTSGMTANVLGGARYVTGERIADRVDAALAEVRVPGSQLLYLYVPELDSIAHAKGWESDRWTAALEELDGELARLDRSVPSDVGVLVTADHGVLDVPDHANIAIDPDLLDDVVGFAGDPRCRQLTLAPGTDAEELVARWRARYGKRCWVATRDEAVAAGWFGTATEVGAARVGDVVVVARGSWAFNDDRAVRPGLVPGRMIGQHGAMTDAETDVPLRLAGAFAN